jgi:hypothetical protein
MSKRSLKLAFLAASALAAATPAALHAAPTIESSRVSQAIHSEEPALQAPTARLAGLAAVAAAIAAFIGRRRLASWLRKAAPAVKTAAGAVVAAPVVAARVVGRAVASPLRSLAFFAGVGLFALAGLGLYDVEWAGGLAAGLVLAIAFAGVRRVKRAPMQATATRSDKFNQ